MSDVLPPPLHSLLRANDPATRARAWRGFLETYSDLILRASRTLGGDEDASLDRYAFVLDQLQRDDHRRLRQFSADGRSQFTTWLVVVVKRLCLDEHRRRFGRVQGDSEASHDRNAMRQRLVHLVGDDAKLVTLPDLSDSDPESLLRESELHAALERALATLPVGDRLLLRLRFEDDASVPQIARLLRAPSAGHVYRRLEALLDELRRRLVSEGIRDPRP